MWVRVGKVPVGDQGVELLKQVDRTLRAAGYAEPPLRADLDAGVVFLDVGVEGSPPEPLVRDALARAAADRG